MTLDLIIAFAGVAICALASIIVSALREYSQTKLEDRLKHRGEAVIAQYRNYAEDRELSITTAMLIRGIGVVSTVLAIGFAVAGHNEATLVEFLAAGVIAFVLVSFMGTIVPELIAAYFAENILLCGLPVMAVADRVFRPLTLLVQLCELMGKRLLGAREVSDEQELEEEILDGLAQGERGQLVDPEQAEMIKSIFDFHETDVRDIMTPRTDVVMIQADTPMMEAVQQAIECGHSRIPVYGANRDEIVGVLYAKDLLKTWVTGNSENGDLRSFLRKPYFVPQTKEIGELLRELRTARVHLAVILDEYGGCAGIVTIEDIVEEIIGEIQDEHDDDSDIDEIVSVGEGIVECSGLTHIEEIESALDIEIEDNNGNLDTVGGYVFSHLGSIPAVESEHVIGKLRFNVLACDDRRINRLRVEVIKNGES